MPIVAWYMLSNESYMNLVMSEVFPTAVALSASALAHLSIENGLTVPLCSPRNTNLFDMVSKQAPTARCRPEVDNMFQTYLNFFKGLL
jgi:hypothetical protein